MQGESPTARATVLVPPPLSFSADLVAWVRAGRGHTGVGFTGRGGLTEVPSPESLDAEGLIWKSPGAVAELYGSPGRAELGPTERPVRAFPGGCGTEPGWGGGSSDRSKALSPAVLCPNPSLLPLELQGWEVVLRALPAFPTLTWKIARLALGGAAAWGVAVASPWSHSWMVTILRGGKCRWVRRAFLRWWKSPSVRVYLQGWGMAVSMQTDEGNLVGSVWTQVLGRVPYRRPLSCPLRLCSKSAASLKDTRRPTVLPARKRSVSASWLSGSSPGHSGSVRRGAEGGPGWAWGGRAAGGGEGTRGARVGTLTHPLTHSLSARACDTYAGL